jgi:hypothetical protein
MDRAKAYIRVAGALAVASAVIFIGGCSARKPIQIVNKPGQDALTAWIAAVKAGITDAGQTTATVNDPTGRNLAISYSEAAVMARYAALRNNLLTGRATTKVIFDVIELGLTAGVPITNGSRGKTILGSLATGFKGTNLSIDRNVFNEQTTATILSAMDTCVLRQQKVIAGKSALTIDRYTIYNGYADLTRLYGCTTLAGALQELSEDQGAAAKQEQQKTLIAPITAGDVVALREIQIAFAASVAGDKKLALAFFEEMKVQGLTVDSEPKEFFAAYRGLSAVLSEGTEVQRLIAAARKVKLLTVSTN